MSCPGHTYCWYETTKHREKTGNNRPRAGIPFGLSALEQTAWRFVCLFTGPQESYPFFLAFQPLLSIVQLAEKR